MRNVWQKYCYNKNFICFSFDKKIASKINTHITFLLRLKRIIDNVLKCCNKYSSAYKVVFHSYLQNGGRLFFLQPGFSFIRFFKHNIQIADNNEQPNKQRHTPTTNYTRKVTEASKRQAKKK
jgi:hypothetical protein